MISLKAGGTGLNLTAASHVVHFDRWWNPAVENQATDRAFRIGQTRNVLVHKFVCRGTVEEKIDALIESKQQISRDLLEGGAELLMTEMNNDELLKLRRAGYPRRVGGISDARGTTNTTMRFPEYVSVGERRRKAEREAAKRGRYLTYRHQGHPDREDVLGQILVPEPRTIQRLRESSAARPDLRPQRLRLRSENQLGSR